MKQQDIFYITKYANKFHIDQKNLIQWTTFELHTNDKLILIILINKRSIWLLTMNKCVLYKYKKWNNNKTH